MRLIFPLIATLASLAASSVSATDITSFQRAAKNAGFFDGEVDGKLGISTVAASFKLCRLAQVHCRDAESIQLRYYFQQAYSIRNAMIRSTDMLDRMSDAFESIYKNSRLNVNAGTISALMRGAIASSIVLLPDGRLIVYYNPVTDVILLLRIKDGDPTQAKLVLGERLRGMAALQEPQWLASGNSNPREWSLNTEKIRKVFTEDSGLALALINELTPPQKYSDEEIIISTRLAYAREESAGDRTICQKALDDYVRGKNYLGTPKNSVEFPIASPIPVYGINFQDDIYMRIYFDLENPQLVLVLSGTDQRCDDIKSFRLRI